MGEGRSERCEQERVQVDIGPKGGEGDWRRGPCKLSQTGEGS